MLKLYLPPEKFKEHQDELQQKYRNDIENSIMCHRLIVWGIFFIGSAMAGFAFASAVTAIIIPMVTYLQGALVYRLVIDLLHNDIELFKLMTYGFTVINRDDEIVHDFRKNE